MHREGDPCDKVHARERGRPGIDVQKEEAEVRAWVDRQAHFKPITFLVAKQNSNAPKAGVVIQFAAPVALAA